MVLQVFEPLEKEFVVCFNFQGCYLFFITKIRGNMATLRIKIFLEYQKYIKIIIYLSNSVASHEIPELKFHCVNLHL